MKKETNDEAAIEKLNNTTWEDLNPDWTEDGNLTYRFAKSQFDDCPGCGRIEQLDVANVGQDDPCVIVICRDCQWSTHGDTPSEAIERWNVRAASEKADNDGWILVKDEMPVNDEPVLTSIDTAYNQERRIYQVLIQSYCEGEWETQDVIAWRPLPESYKEKTQ